MCISSYPSLTGSVQALSWGRSDWEHDRDAPLRESHPTRLRHSTIHKSHAANSAGAKVGPPQSSVPQHQQRLHPGYQHTETSLVCAPQVLSHSPAEARGDVSVKPESLMGV